MTADEQSRTLASYCDQHRCTNCPMNVAELACADPDDLCVVSLALGELARKKKEEVAA